MKLVACVLLAFAVQVLCQQDEVYPEPDSGEVYPEPNSEDVYAEEYFPAVATASFTGPQIVGEFNFYQDTKGDVVATGAFQKGLQQDVKYKFAFYEGPSCESLGQLVLEHEFEAMHVVNMGGTPPIQELIPDIHLSGDNNFSGAPWVLSDDERALACVILTKPDAE